MDAHRRRVIVLAVLGTVALGVFLAYRSVFTPFLIGLLAAYLLDPLVVFLERSRLPLGRGPAILLVFGAFLVSMTGLALLLYPLLEGGVSALIQTVGANQESLTRFFADALDWLENIELPFEIEREKLLASLNQELTAFIESFFRELSAFLLSILNSLPTLLIIPLIVFYFLKDKQKIFSFFSGILRDDREAGLVETFRAIDGQIGGYLKGQVFLSGLVAVITTVALWILGIPYAVLIGLANGVLNVIPYVGPVIGAIPAIVLAVIGFRSPGHLAAVIAFFVAMNVLVSALLSPKIFSRSTNLHPLLVVLSIFLGAEMLGMMGMILAIPVAIVLKTMIGLYFKKYVKEI